MIDGKANNERCVLFGAKVRTTKVDLMENEKVFAMSFSKVYGLLIAKAERKGRTKAEVEEVTFWLTGYSAQQIDEFMDSEISYGDFFRQAPAMNPNREKITGVVCGIRVENAFSIVSGNFAAIRIFSFLKKVLILDHIFSIGFKSGLYGGK